MPNKPTYEELEQRVRELEASRTLRRKSSLDRVIESIPAGIVVHGADGVVINTNTAAQIMLGLKHEHMLGKELIDPAWTFLREDGSQMPVEEYPVSRVLKTKKPINIVAAITHSEKTEPIWVLDTAIPEFDENGNISQVITTFMDISSLKDTEKALKESEERFRSLYNNAPLGYQSLNSNGCYIDVNPAWLKMMGYTRAEVIGKRFVDFLAPEEKELFNQRFTIFKSTGEVHVDVQMIKSDGSGVIIHIDGMVGKDKKGKFKQTHCILQDITERKYFELLLEKKNTDLYLAQRIASIGTWTLDPEVGVPEWSEEIYRIYERDPNLGSYPLYEYKNIYKGKWFEKFNKAIQSAINDGTPYDIELKLEFPTGKEKWIHAICEPEPEIGPKGHKVRGTIEDITKKRQAEEALRESKLRFERMLDVIPDLISIHDPEMNIVYSNWQGFGAIPEGRRLIHTKCYKTYRGFDTICPDCLAKGVMDSGQSLQEEAKLPDGTWIDLRVIPILDNEGNVEMFMEWVRDITSQKEAQIELQSQKKLLEAVLDSIKDVIGVQLPDHTVLQYNQAGYDILGIDKKNAKGIKCYELIGRISPCKICATSKAVKTKTIETIEKYIPELGGHFLCTSNPVLDEDGNVKLVIEQLADITEQKMAEERLRQAQKMESIGNLAGGIAHDFNNILFPIIGMSEMLLEDLPPKSIERENAEEIYKAGIRGSDLVKQILAFSRQSEHKKMPTRIQNVLKEVIKLSRSTIPTYIEIKKDIQQDCGMVLADPSQIHQIGMNIITNAYHAVEDTGGTISIKLKQNVTEAAESPEILLSPNSYAVLSISDTGHGISEELIDKIFDPYFTTKEQGKGTGLGLAVVYGIVKDHGGDIKVHSEIGRGTTLEIYFPLMEKFNSTESTSEIGNYQGGSERILLVDDEEPVAKLEKQMLERLGYKVTSRLHSVEALEAFRTRPLSFDLVITDMSMPNIPGDDLARKIKSIRSNVPIIVCTGFSERISEDKFEQIGIEGLLMKPIVKSELAKTVRKVIDKAKSANKK